METVNQIILAKSVNIFRRKSPHLNRPNNVIGVNSSITYNFASVLFDFTLREMLLNKTDAKI